MARKKPITTYHLIDIARSLEKQNEAVSLIIAEFESFLLFAESVPAEVAARLKARIEETRAILWPEREG